MAQGPSITRRILLALALLALVAGLFALPAAAETFTIELHNGEVMFSKYRPQESSWSSEEVLLLTDQGNWVGFPKADIKSVVAETEARGFGRVIDTTTVVLGWAANDAPLEEDESQYSAVERLQQLLGGQEQDYSVPQFVSPSQAGQGGIPATGITTAPGASIGYIGVPQPPVAAPPAAPSPPGEVINP
ncbi:MAG: hypothetical protein AAF604_17055 [Acidobacteriota bacterium]